MGITQEKILHDRFYALVKKPAKGIRRCLKCGKRYKITENSRHVCTPCGVLNDHMGKTSSWSNY